MIAFGWYFWVILALTLNACAHSTLSVFDGVVNKKAVSVWVLPEIVGLLWCTHHVLEVLS